MKRVEGADSRPTSGRAVIPALLLYGGIWGLAEATIGHLLHLIPRMAAVPPLAGLVMFPVGVVLMLAAVHATAKPAAAVGVAMIAAAIKASSVLLAPVSWLFVQNPALSILMEGLVVWAFVAAFSMHRASSGTLLPAIGAALSWRVLFVLAHLVFGIQWGLPARGVPAVLQFVLLDSVVNGVLIALLLRARLPQRLALPPAVLARGIPVAAVLALAVLAEYATSLA